MQVIDKMVRYSIAYCMQLSHIRRMKRQRDGSAVAIY
jgi:hypothetical protein